MNEPTPENYQSSQPEISPEDAAVYEMLQLALKEGLDKAIDKVKEMGNPDLQERFHDVIMNNPDLKAQFEASGKIEKL